VLCGLEEIGSCDCVDVFSIFEETSWRRNSREDTGRLMKGCELVEAASVLLVGMCRLGRSEQEIVEGQALKTKRIATWYDLVKLSITVPSLNMLALRNETSKVNLGEFCTTMLEL
jgi:hypothetical protein